MILGNQPSLTAGYSLSATCHANITPSNSQIFKPMTDRIGIASRENKKGSSIFCLMQDQPQRLAYELTINAFIFISSSIMPEM